MLGFAYQQGLVPVSAAAIERAIELNGIAVEANKQAFLWGRRAAHRSCRGRARRGARRSPTTRDHPARRWTRSSPIARSI